MNSGIIYFSLVFFTAIFNLMNISINGNYIARTFYEMPPTVVKSAVYALKTDIGFSPHFDSEKLKVKVIEYLDKSLASKIDKYTIGFVFMEYYNGVYSIDYTGMSDAVDIKFSCKYNTVFEFSGYINFTVEGVYEDGWEPNWNNWK